MSGAWSVLALGMLCGATVWALSVPLTGMREAFDAPGFYYLAMVIAGAVAALPAPRYWWLAVIAIFAGERLYAFVMLPETRAWLLVGIVLNAVIPTWLPAAIGAGRCSSRVACWRGRVEQARRLTQERQAAGPRRHRPRHVTRDRALLGFDGYCNVMAAAGECRP